MAITHVRSYGHSGAAGQGATGSVGAAERVANYLGATFIQRGVSGSRAQFHTPAVPGNNDGYARIFQNLESLKAQNSDPYNPWPSGQDHLPVIWLGFNDLDDQDADLTGAVTRFGHAMRAIISACRWAYVFAGSSTRTFDDSSGLTPNTATDRNWGDRYYTASAGAFAEEAFPSDIPAGAVFTVGGLGWTDWVAEWEIYADTISQGTIDQSEVDPYGSRANAWVKRIEGLAASTIHTLRAEVNSVGGSGQAILDYMALESPSTGSFAPVVLINCARPPDPTPYFGGSIAAQEAAIADLNAELEAVAAEFPADEVIVIDSDGLFDKDPGWWSGDLLHNNDYGYQHLANTILEQALGETIQMTPLNTFASSGGLGVDRTIDLTSYPIGSLAIVAVAASSIDSFTDIANDGWTIEDSDDATIDVVVCWREKAEGETTFSFGVGGSSSISAVVLPPGAKFGQISAVDFNAASGTAMAFDSITISADTSVSLVVAAWASSSATTFTPPTGYTKGSFATPPNGNSTAMAWDDSVSAGALDPADGSLSTARTQRYGWHIEILHVVPVEAEIASTLPALSSAATAKVTVDGSAASDLPALEQAAAAALTVEASVASDLPALGQSATAELIATGAVASTLPALSQAATAELAVGGAAASNLPPLGQAVTAKLAVLAQTASDLPPLAQAASALATIDGQIVTTLPALAQLADAVLRVSGAIASDLPALSTAATGEVSSPAVSGSIASDLPALATQATGKLTVEADIAATLPALGQSAAGAIGAVEAVITSDLPPLSGLATGALRVDGSAASVLAALTQAALAELRVEAQIVSTLPALSSGAAGTLTVRGVAGMALPALEAALTGTIGDLVVGEATPPQATQASRPRAIAGGRPYSW